MVCSRYREFDENDSVVNLRNLRPQKFVSVQVSIHVPVLQCFCYMYTDYIIYFCTSSKIEILFFEFYYRMIAVVLSVFVVLTYTVQNS